MILHVIKSAYHVGIMKQFIISSFLNFIYVTIVDDDLNCAKHTYYLKINIVRV